MQGIKLKERLKRAVAVLFFIVIFSAESVLPTFAVGGNANAEAKPPDMTGVGAVYLYNLEEKLVMAEKNSKEQIYPASTVKIMTGLVAIEALAGRYDGSVTVTEDMLKGVTGNNIKLKAGETVSYTDLLYALLCGSANDAAAVLAFAVSGSVADFVRLMNAKAAMLGALETNYTNVSGMHDDKMVTTAYDTFLIAKAAAENGLFVEMTTESKYVMPETNMSAERNIYNKNSLVSRYTETKYYSKYAKGLNAGYTTQGGYCLATIAESDGETYICVVMNGEEINGDICSYTVANDLIDYVFSSYGYVEVLSPDRLVCEVGVTLSDAVDYVTLRPKEAIKVFLPLSVNPEKDLVYSHKVTEAEIEAPVAEGQTAGFITVEYKGEVIGSTELVTMNSVDRSEFLYVMKRIRDFTGSRVFIVSAVSFVILLVVYIIGTAIYRGTGGRRHARGHGYGRKRRR